MNKVNLVVVVADVVVESEVAEDADPAAELHVIRDDRVVHLAPDAVQKYVDPALNKYQLGLQNRRERKLLHGVPPYLSGFVCAYHPAALGSSTKHAIYAFSFIEFVLYLCYICHVKRTKINKKRRGLAHFF